MFATLDRKESLSFALCALKLQHNFLGRLSLLSENRLCLTTKTLLFHVVTTFTLSFSGVLPFFVLGHLVQRVFAALPAGTQSHSRLRNVHLQHLRVKSWVKRQKLQLKKPRNAATSQKRHFSNFTFQTFYAQRMTLHINSTYHFAARPR